VQPGGRWDTLLQPDTDYGFQVNVHNDSPTPAVNTVVRFWSFPGGVGTAGTLLDVQTATIPANSSVIVASGVPFHSAAAGQHECAVVSIANAQSAYFNVDPGTAAQLADPDSPPGVANPHSGTAWRNSDSEWVILGRPWTLNLAATVPTLIHVPHPDPVEVQVAVTARQVPAGFAGRPEVLALQAALRSVGAQSRAPLFLAAPLRRNLPVADLGVSLTGPDGARHAPDARHSVRAGQPLPFKVHGTLPAGAARGDVFLVEVTAQYHATQHHKARSVGYLQVLYVKG